MHQEASVLSQLVGQEAQTWLLSTCSLNSIKSVEKSCIAVVHAMSLILRLKN